MARRHRKHLVESQQTPRDALVGAGKPTGQHAAVRTPGSVGLTPSEAISRFAGWPKGLIAAAILFATLATLTKEVREFFELILGLF